MTDAILQEMLAELDDIHSNIRVLLHSALIDKKVKTTGEAVDSLVPHLKAFITAAVLRTREDEQDRAREIPMGVSQWMNYGRKFGYWEFFEKEVREATVAVASEEFAKRAKEK